jgi:hypothetical protein
MKKKKRNHKRENKYEKKRRGEECDTTSAWTIGTNVRGSCTTTFFKVIGASKKNNQLVSKKQTNKQKKKEKLLPHVLKWSKFWHEKIPRSKRAAINIHIIRNKNK